MNEPVIRCSLGRFAGDRLAEPVEHDRQYHDCHAVFEASAEVAAVERVPDMEAEPARAHGRAQDHQVEGEHDHLVETEQQLVACRRHPHHPHQLARRRPGHRPKSISSFGTALRASSVTRIIGGTE